MYFRILLAGSACHVLAFAGACCGLILLSRPPGRGRRAGTVLLGVSALVLLAWYYAGPSVLFRATFGRGPLADRPSVELKQKMESERMTADEVAVLFGSPHRRYEHGGQETWWYALDVSEHESLRVDFGPDGRVKSTWYDS